MLDAHYQYIDSLVQQAKQGDGEALRELSTFYQPLIRASIVRCLERDPRLKPYREDIKQEVFLILHQLVKDYDPSLSFFSYYLATRLDRSILSRCRRFILGVNSSGSSATEIVFSDMPPEWEPVSPEDPFLRTHFRQMLHDAVNNLKPRQKEAIDLYFFKNMTQEQAAREVGITQASFSKRLKRALDTLRKEFSEDFGV